jgi:hypothetical protein
MIGKDITLVHQHKEDSEPESYQDADNKRHNEEGNDGPENLQQIAGGDNRPESPLSDAPKKVPMMWKPRSSKIGESTTFRISSREAPG